LEGKLGGSDGTAFGVVGRRGQRRGTGAPFGGVSGEIDGVQDAQAPVVGDEDLAAEDAAMDSDDLAAVATRDLVVFALEGKGVVLGARRVSVTTKASRSVASSFGKRSAAVSAAQRSSGVWPPIPSCGRWLYSWSR
jgi:hypothetical protein